MIIWSIYDIGRWLVEAPSNNPIQKVLNIPITLSKSKLSNTSKEFVTAVIIHEVVHAYFKATGQKYDFDHNIMANNYVHLFATYLSSLYSLSERDSIALVWLGIPDSEYFKQNNIFNYTNGYIEKNEMLRLGMDYATTERNLSSLGHPTCDLCILK